MGLTAALPNAAGAQPSEHQAPVSIPELTAAALPAPDTSHLVAVKPDKGRMLDVTVYSQAMAKNITLKVLPAPDGSAPAHTLYLLNGGSGGTEGSNWHTKTDVDGFFADKQVNVVIPVGGEGSYFTDWKADDPDLGRQQWKTFLVDELTPIIDSAFHGSGGNSIVGISMSATSVFQLAIAAPETYQAIGSYSGCVGTSDPAGKAMTQAVVTRWNGNPDNMWGPGSDPAWAANDAFVNADKLRGTTIYVAAGTGTAGELDTLDGPNIDNGGTLIGQLVSGGVLEAVMRQCSLQLQNRLAALDIPATFEFRDTGTHSWGYWQQYLHNSWPSFKEAMDRKTQS
ncbi:alpha/beta hydrolase [Nocardia callitridis]|uniref:alpha/beta hydrolase n=1 Tax=Nocardia callitridis TaxID=648753 RepID=UPI0031E59C69